MGVDVFFVLSGFLITSLLLEERDKYGTVNLRFFYMRRVLRLMPALWLMLFAVCGYVWLFQDSKATREALQGAGLTLAYVSNWIQALRPSFSMGPFGITWSLSIEEQFYLIWPITLTVGLSLLNRRKAMIYGLVIAVVLVAVMRLLLWKTGAGTTRLYYGSDTRADALLSGCLAGLLLNWGLLTKESKAKIPLSILTALSCVILIYLILTVHPEDALLYCGGFTVISAMVAVSLVFLSLWSPGWLTSLLTVPPLVWFGRISYGLYLWHWPVLVLVNPKKGIESMPERLMAGGIAVSISAISFYFVERPSLRLKRRFEAV